MNLLDLPERLQSKISPEPMSGCWLWIGACDRDGYGKATRENRSERAHRVVYEAIMAKVPAGLQLDHKCRVRCCVNPDHLEPVTGAENTRRGLNANRSKAACPRGHAYTDENTMLRSGGRFCRECDRARCRERAARVRSGELTPKRRSGAALASHCKRGHAMAPENVYDTGRQRMCKACHSARVSAYKARLQQRGE